MGLPNGKSFSARAGLHVANVARIAVRLLELERASRRTMSAEQRALARSWYPDQRSALARIALGSGLPLEAVVHAAATLSPATHWGTLLRDLPAFLERAKAGDPRPPFATYGRNRELAALIASTVYWAAEGWNDWPRASGPKVRPFALALLGDDSQVVVDRHVARYALDLPDRVNVTTAERRAIQDAHRVAGTALGIPPRDLQSLLWVARVGYGGDAGGARLKASGAAGVPA